MVPESPTAPSAGWGRRAIALFIDWVVALLTVSVLTQTPVVSGGDTNAFLPLAAFWVEVSVLTGLLGHSIGKRVTRLSVVGVDGSPVGLLRAMLRTALVCLVVPPVVANAERRGLHDLAAGSIVVSVPQTR